MKHHRFKLPKWLFTAVLVWTLVIAISTITFAATTGSLPQGLTATGTSTFSWTLSETSIIVTASTSSKTECGSTTYTPREDTITLTSANKATLSISVSAITTVEGIGNGKLTVNDEEFVTGSSKQIPLEANGTVTIKVTSGGTSSNKSSTKFELSISYVPSGNNVTMSFQPVTDIPYKVNSSTAVTDNAADVSGDPADGFSVVADDPHYICTGATLENGSTIPAVAGVISPTTSGKITPIFAYDWNADGVSPFKVGSTSYWDWDSAMTAASAASTKVAVLNENYTLPARTDVYEVPSGVTFLIPHNSSYTLCTTAPETVNASLVKPSVYRTLTMAETAKIVVNGGLSTGGTQNAQYKSNGQPHGPLGVIKMGANSNITVNKGGALYAWGYVVGSGTVTIESEGTVYEDFQVRDYRGGSVTSTLATDQWGTSDDNIGAWHVFPFSQYYMQNVQVPMTLKVGAVEKGYFSVVAGSIQGELVPFIGADSMFQITNGYIVKDYNESTDRLEIDVYGSMEINEFSMSIKVQQLGSEITIKSSDYDLPLNSNITVELFGTSTVDLNQSMILLPGSEIIINEDTTLNVKSGKRLIVYDKDQWAWEGKSTTDGYCSDLYKDVIPLAYVYTDTTIGAPKYTRTVADLVDGRILVNGTLNASAGYLYTTADGGNICSTGNGQVIIQSTAAANAYQIAQRRNTKDDFVKSEELDAHPITSAQLHNGDGTYDTAGNYNHDGTYVSSVDTSGTYNYHPIHKRWVLGEHATVEETVTKDPACTETGEATVKCSCSYICTEELPATGVHTDTQTSSTQEGFLKCDGCDIPLVRLAAIEASADAATELRMKFYIHPSLTTADDGSKLDMKALVQFAGVNPTNTPVTLSDMEVDKSGRYVFICNVNSGEMRRNMTVSFTDASGNPVIILDGQTSTNAVSRSVADYAELVLDRSQDERQKNVIKHLLTYGGYAQIHFNVDADNPVYNLLTDRGIELPDLTGTTIPEVTSLSTSVGDIVLKQAEVFLQSAIKMQYTYTADTPDDDSFLLTYVYKNQSNKKQVTPKEAGTVEGKSAYYLAVEEIPAAYFGHRYALDVTEGENSGSFAMSVYDYLYLKLKPENAPTESMINLAKAMYLYGEAANEFFFPAESAQ